MAQTIHTPKQQVAARFSLVETARRPYYTTGAQAPVEAIQVKLAAVKGEPFGPATPSGHIEMLIVNPEAALVFHHAALGQEFDLLFTPHVAAE